MAQQQFTITSIQTAKVELKNDNGQTLSIGYKKNPDMLMDLRTKQVGDKLILDVETSSATYGSHLYLAESWNMRKAFSDVLLQRLKIKAAEMQIEALKDF